MTRADLQARADRDTAARPDLVARSIDPVDPLVRALLATHDRLDVLEARLAAEEARSR